MNDDLIEVGQCHKPHGIKGGFSFSLAAHDESVLQHVKTILLFPKGPSSTLCASGVEYTIEQISFGNKVIVYLDGISTRNQAEELIPFVIKVSRSDFAPITADGEFYIADLLHTKVFDHLSGKEIGVISSFYENNAQTVFVIQNSSGGELIELPFVDHFFPVVDLDNKRVEILLPEIINDK
ncbi:MAG: 16S rRNA processing protein RimM [Bacteriovoracaceae bacterium]|nr:16S rRNA processing protein RimM [Bacteriovoracaceae bacterium]